MGRTCRVVKVSGPWDARGSAHFIQPLLIYKWEMRGEQKAVLVQTHLASELGLCRSISRPCSNPTHSKEASLNNNDEPKSCPIMYFTRLSHLLHSANIY